MRLRGWARAAKSANPIRRRWASASHMVLQPNCGRADALVTMQLLPEEHLLSALFVPSAGRVGGYRAGAHDRRQARSRAALIGEASGKQVQSAHDEAGSDGDPYGNRTRVSAVRGPRPNR